MHSKSFGVVIEYVLNSRVTVAMKNAFVCQKKYLKGKLEL